MEESIEFYKKKLLTVKPNTVSSKYLKFMINMIPFEMVIDNLKNSVE